MYLIKKTIIGVSAAFLFLVPLILPCLAFAASATVNSNVWNLSILQGPLVTCVGATTSTLPIQPTCQSFCDLFATVANVIYFCIAVVIWIIAPIMFLWAGILFMTSAGNQERVGQARKMLTGTVIGVLIVLCAYLLVYTFVNVLQLQQYVGGFGTNACIILP